MAEPLKNLYSPLFFEKLRVILGSIVPQFDDTRFIHSIFDTEWPDLELKQRTRKVTAALHSFLPADFKQAASYLVEIANHYKENNDNQMSFPLIFLPDYVEVYGLEHFNKSMQALEQITQLISAEFAIRPFIIKYPEKAMRQMEIWSSHKNLHVRRLSSEGCRPRLPWAMALPAFKSNPNPILPILENLKKDPSEYVRKSVANNLNDIAKDHPDLVLKIVKKWKGLSPETDWILKHGSRTLLKKGHTHALAIHGFKTTAKTDVKELKLSKPKFKIGETAQFKFLVLNKENRKSKIRIEYAIDYLTSTGKISRKVFQVSERDFHPDEQIEFVRNQRFTDFTTRKHFPGKHKLYIVVSGIQKREIDFNLVK